MPRRFCLLLPALLLCLSLLPAAAAEEGAPFTDSASGLTFRLLPASGTAEVTAGSYTGERYIIPKTVTHNGTVYPVTAIGSGAFFGCSALKEVTIPNSVTKIGYQAFYSCRALEQITLPPGLTAIREATFYHCDSLTAIHIPNAVAVLEQQAFSCCGRLSSVTFGPRSQLKTVGPQAFDYCVSLTDMALPESVTAVGALAFASCADLETVTLPAGASLDPTALLNCPAHVTVTLPDCSFLRLSSLLFRVYGLILPPV